MELDSQRTASWVCRTSDGGSWSSREDSSSGASDVVDDRQPLVGGVAVGVAVELERAVAAVQGVGRVGLGGGEKLVRELRPRAVGEGVDEVDGDAERGGGRDRGREEGDRPLRGGVRCLAEQLLAAAVGGRVADGEFLMGPGAAEVAVGLARGRSLCSAA